MIGLCNDSEGSEQGAEQGPVRADQAAGDLFRSGGADWRAAFLFSQGRAGHHHGSPVHDPGHAALLPVRHVRAERAAPGGVPWAPHSEQVYPPKGADLPNQQPVLRACAAARIGTGGESDCRQKPQDPEKRQSPDVS